MAEERRFLGQGVADLLQILQRLVVVRQLGMVLLGGDPAGMHGLRQAGGLRAGFGGDLLGIGRVGAGLLGGFLGILDGSVQSLLRLGVLEIVLRDQIAAEAAGREAGAGADHCAPCAADEVAKSGAQDGTDHGALGDRAIKVLVRLGNALLRRRGVRVGGRGTAGQHSTGQDHRGQANAEPGLHHARRHGRLRNWGAIGKE